MAQNLSLHPCVALSVYVAPAPHSDLFNRLLALFDSNRVLELLVWFKSMGGLEYENVMDVN